MNRRRFERGGTGAPNDGDPQAATLILGLAGRIGDEDRSKSSTGPRGAGVAGVGAIGAGRLVDSSAEAKLTADFQRWLDAEQTLNERIDRDADGRIRIVLDHHNVKAAWRPERRGVWPQEVVWLPRDRARQYGAVSETIANAFGLEVPLRKTPLFVHPQAPAAHRRLMADHRCERPGIWATPTSSCRTVLVWSDARPPVFLKLSLGARVSGARRSLSERDLLSGLVISRLLDLIPTGTNKRVGFDWFSEPLGTVDAVSGTGWIMRKFPRRSSARRCWWIPAFSLISRRSESPPMLVDMIAESGLAPEQFILEHMLRPYVGALGWLLFEEGIQVEGHTQNILYEMSDDGELTGQIALRDLSDMSVSIEHRIARQRPFPDLSEFVREEPPFSVASAAADFQCGGSSSGPRRASATVERFGLRGFVWAINTSMARYYRGYRRAHVEREYLGMWQDELARRLGVKAPSRKERLGLAVDEAFLEFWRRVDWRGLGARRVRQTPKAFNKATPGNALLQIECPWGELFLEQGIPAWFRPAF